LSCETCQGAREEGLRCCYDCGDTLEPLSNVPAYCNDADDADDADELTAEVGLVQWRGEQRQDTAGSIEYISEELGTPWGKTFGDFIRRLDEEEMREAAEEQGFINDSEATEWYSKFFDYVGDFVEGLAPVVLCAGERIQSGYRNAGYVAVEQITFLSRTCQTSKCGYRILGYGPIALPFVPSELVWTGEFRNGRALVVVKDRRNVDDVTLHMLDRHGNAEKLGYVHKHAGPVQKDGTLAKAFVCTLVLDDIERDCIVDRKGDFIRDRDEYIMPLCEGEVDYARVAPIPSLDGRSSSDCGNPFRLVRISDGKVVSAGYCAIEGQLLEMYDGTFAWFIGMKQKVQTGPGQQPSYRYGCYKAGEGFILEAKYERIEMILDGCKIKGYGSGRFLNFLLWLGTEEEADGSTWYLMAVADAGGRIVAEYKSLAYEYAAIDGRVLVMVQERRGCSVVGLDGSTLFYMAGATKVQDFKQGYFRVENAEKQCGLVNLTGEFTIPYERFEDLLDSSPGPFLAIKAKQNDLVGYVDVLGHVLVPLEHTDLYEDYPFAEDSVRTTPE